MTRRSVATLLALAVLGSWPGATEARQQNASPAQARAAESTDLTALKITVVIARFAGEKQTSNLPFTFYVNAGEGERTSLRVGATVAIPQSDRSYQYSPIGTNIDCSARDLGNGQYRLSLTLNDTSVASPRSEAANSPPSLPSFTITTAPILRDGQTLEFTNGVDKATGETTRVSITLNVVK